MSTDAKESSSQELLKIVESARRAKNYREALTAGNTLIHVLREDTSPEASVLRSKFHYEWSMARFQQGEDEPEEAAKLALYGDALVEAEKSANEADTAGDPVGRLFAEMNISGLFMPRMGRLADAYALSDRVYNQAQEIAAAGMTSKEDRKRAFRIAMNAAYHQIEMAKQILRLSLIALEGNPVYESYKDEEWAKKPVEAARAYVEAK